MEAGVAQRPLSRLAQAWSELTTLLWNLLSEATEILDWFLRKRGPPPRCELHAGRTWLALRPQRQLLTLLRAGRSTRRCSHAPP